MYRLSRDGDGWLNLLLESSTSSTFAPQCLFLFSSPPTQCSGKCWSIYTQSTTFSSTLHDVKLATRRFHRFRALTTMFLHLHGSNYTSTWLKAQPRRIMKSVPQDLFLLPLLRKEKFRRVRSTNEKLAPLFSLPGVLGAGGRGLYWKDSRFVKNELMLDCIIDIVQRFCHKS